MLPLVMIIQEAQFQKSIKPFDKNSNLLFMPTLFQEAMDIIFDSYEYFQIQDEQDDGQLSPQLHALIANEMSRITMRLTSVMAWLMARKAVAAGQLSDNEARDEYRINGADQCLEYHGEYAPYLPDYLNELLETSYRLYQRIWQLDKQIYGEPA